MIFFMIFGVRPLARAPFFMISEFLAGFFPSKRLIIEKNQNTPCRKAATGLERPSRVVWVNSRRHGEAKNAVGAEKILAP